MGPRRLATTLLVVATLLTACSAAPKPPSTAPTAPPPATPPAPAAPAELDPRTTANVTRTQGPWFPDDPHPDMKSYAHPPKPHRSQYTLDITVDPVLFALTGKQTLRFTNDEAAPLPSLVFHLYPNAPYHTQQQDDTARVRPGQLTLQEIVVDGQKVTARFSPDREIAEVPLPKPLAPGESVALQMNWHAVIPSVPDRLGVIGPAIYMAHAFPILAMHDQGGWHVDRFMDTGDPFYSEVADFDVALTVPDGWQMAATGHYDSPEPVGDGQTRFHFSAQNVRDFASVTSAKWQRYEADVDGIHVRYFRDTTETKTPYAPGGNLIGPSEVLRYATGALHFFNQKFGQYPYADFTIVDHIGMEYPQLIMAEARPTFVIHEVAHQWWYGVVGNDELRQIWDEGLTQFATAYFQASIGEFNGFTYGAQATEAMTKTLYTYHQHAYAQNADKRSYGNTIYGRGTLLWEALRESMGTPAFDKMLQDFYAAHKFGVATWDDVRQAIVQHAGDPGQQLFATYVVQEEYPTGAPTGMPMP